MAIVLSYTPIHCYVLIRYTLFVNFLIWIISHVGNVGLYFKVNTTSLQ